MAQRRLKVVWISFFPVEWMPGIPASLQSIPRQHSAPWQRVLLAELTRQPQLDLHVVVLRKAFNQDQVFRLNGATFHCLRVAGGLRRTTLYWADTLRLRRYLAELRPDLVHAWGTEDGAAWVASRLGFPFVVTVQGLMEWYASVVRDAPWPFRMAGVMERWALRRCQIVTAESTFSSAYVRQHYPHLRVHHIDLVPDRMFHRIERQVPEGPGRVVFVGPLGYAKGADVLIDSLCRLETPLDVVAIGRPVPAMLDRLGRCPASIRSRFTVLQDLTSEEVAAHYQRATLLVSPTRVDTGPMSVKEAVVAGVPVVGSRVGGIPDYVEHGRNGLLFSPGDVDGCVESLRTAMAHPLFGRGRVDPDFVEVLRKRMAPSAMGEAFLQLYQSNGRPLTS